jgi:hypothetical protein
MSFNGSGVFLRVMNWTNDAASSIKIRADRHDQEDDNLANGLSQCITKDGQTTVTANLPMAGFRHTGTGAAASRTDYARADQLADGVINWAVAGGTANALTASYTLTTTTLKDGQLFYVRAATANTTTTPTFSPDGLTARTITANGGGALPVGAWAQHSEIVLRYNLANTRYEFVGNSVAGVFTTLSATVTSAGAATIPLTIINNSSTASTEVKTTLQPSITSTRVAEIAAKNDGSNNISLILRPSAGGSFVDSITLPPTGGATIASGKTLLAASTTAYASTRLPAGTAPTSPVEGDVWNDSTQKCLDTYVDGVNQAIDTVLFTQTGSNTVSNTTTETTILGGGAGTKTVPANFLVAGKTIAFDVTGTIINTGTPTLRVRVKLGSDTVIDTGVATTSAITGTRSIRVQGMLTCRTTGVSGTVFGQATISYGTGASTIVFLDATNTAATTIDTTLSRVIDVTAQWGTASASNTIVGTNSFIKILN